MEKKVFDKKDFIRTENYNIRIRQSGLEKLVKELMVQFSSKTPYGRTSMEWGYVLSKKAGELAKFLKGETRSLDFSRPEPDIRREDSYGIRERILNLSYTEWKKKGYSKGTLHYLKKRVKDKRPFKLHSKSKNRISDFQS